MAETILAAFGDPRARRELEALAAAPEPPSGWLAPEEQGHGPMLRERARRASAAVAGRALGSSAPGLGDALEQAATLFDAGLYFETHEVLEPWWRDARGDAKEALQGLIQVAVGYQHWANANLAGARALLEEGSDRLRGRRLAGLDLASFAAAVREASEGGFASSSSEGATPPRTPRPNAPPRRIAPAKPALEPPYFDTPPAPPFPRRVEGTGVQERG